MRYSRALRKAKTMMSTFTGGEVSTKNPSTSLKKNSIFFGLMMMMMRMRNSFNGSAKFHAPTILD